MQGRESITTTSVPGETPALPIDVILYVDATDDDLVLTLDNPTTDNPNPDNPNPDFVRFTLTQPERLARFTFRPRTSGARVTTKATSVLPSDEHLLIDGPYVLPLNADAEITITHTPAAQQGKPKPKPKDFGVTLQVRPKGAPL